MRGADTVTVTKNEILTALNRPDSWLLALVEAPPAPDFHAGDTFHGIAEAGEAYGSEVACVVRYVRRPFVREPDFGVTSSNYAWRELWERGESPT